MEEGQASTLKREASLRMSMFIDQDGAANRNWKEGRRGGTVLSTDTEWKLQDGHNGWKPGEYML